MVGQTQLDVQLKCDCCDTWGTPFEKGTILIDLPSNKTDYMCSACWGLIILGCWAWYTTHPEGKRDARKLFSESLEAHLREKFE